MQQFGYYVNRARHAFADKRAASLGGERMTTVGKLAHPDPDGADAIEGLTVEPMARSSF